MEEKKEVFTGLSLVNCLAGIEDPRLDRKKLFPLEEILFLALCAMICGAESFHHMALFGKHHLDFLRTHLPYINGTPSHDTLARVFSLINPKQFTACLQNYLSLLKTRFEAGAIVAIDGKTARRSHDANKEQPAIHVVSAFASEYRLVLGQIKVSDKSNEITAIPELLDMLDLKGLVVTIDAMGCQRNIAKKIVESKADYVLSLKKNQDTAFKEVETFFKLEPEKPALQQSLLCHKETDKGHGRIESRTCTVSPRVDCMSSSKAWSNIKSLVKVESTREIKGERSIEVRYYLSSLAPDPKKILHATRMHWGVENSLHWILDVVLREDDSRIRIKNAPENMGILRRFSLNILQKAKSAKESIKGLRMSAGWNNEILSRILSQV